MDTSPPNPLNLSERPRPAVPMVNGAAAGCFDHHRPSTIIKESEIRNVLYGIPIESFPFASATTRARVEEHGNALAQWEIDTAANERKASEFDQFDAMTVDPDIWTETGRAVARQEIDLLRRGIRLAQQGVPIVGALHQERAAAEADCLPEIGHARQQVREALSSQCGLAHWLNCDDLVAKAQAAQLVDLSTIVAPHIRRYVELRDAATSLHQLAGDYQREAEKLTERLKGKLNAERGSQLAGV